MSANTEVTDVSLFGKIAGYIEILYKDPHSTVFVPLSDAYRKLGLTDDAIKALRKGTESVPTYTPGFVALARLLAESGDLAGAAATFQKALVLEPEHLPALTGMIRVHMLRNENDQALQLLRRAHQLAPDDALVSRMVAGMPGARAMLAASAPAAPAVPQPRTSGAVTATAVEAVEAVEDSIELPPDAKPPIATATIADIYISQGFPEKALKVYGDLLQSEPHNQDVRMRYEALRRDIEGSQVAPPISAATTVPAMAGAETVNQATAVVQQEGARGTEQRIATLQRWLSAVNRRRAHV